MKDLRTVRANEKLKRASTLVGNAGLALLIAAVTRWFAHGVDIVGGLWILISAALIWGGVQVNELLESEDLE